jgi:outer membrane protein OmpA-like peptidoglycan-associated protein
MKLQAHSMNFLLRAAWLALLPLAALAQTGARQPTAQELVERLRPDTPEEAAIRPRGISVEGRRAQVQAPSVDLDVNFEYASAALTPDARAVLDTLGKALTDPALKDSRFQVAGHTDASGSDAVNLALSEQRAQTVAVFLQREYGISAKRLQVNGFGRSKLLDAANPLSAVNRRVQIVNLGQ